MIEKDLIDKIVNDTNIVEVVGEYVKLTKKGNSYFGLCPFHDDNHASMSVSNKVHLFNCFSCGTKGSVIQFVSKFENIPFEEACIKLGKRLGMEINPSKSKEFARNDKLYQIMEETKKFYSFYLKNSEEGLQALEYLHKRDISDEIIEEFEIGLAPSGQDYLYQVLKQKGFLEIDLMELGLIGENNNRQGYHDVFQERVIFPLKNQFNKVIGFSGRIYRPNSNMAKYINSKESVIFHKGDVLYNLNRSQNQIRKVDKVILFEGFMDVIAAYKAGITNTVATMGTALTQKHCDMMLALTKNIVLCFDGDDPGIIAMKKSAGILSKRNIIPSSIVLPEELDPDEYLLKYGKEALVSFIESNEQPVFTQIYNLNKKKLNLQDLHSIENFKTNVFDFLMYLDSATARTYYLKQLAQDLSVEESIVNQEFERFTRHPLTPQNNQKNNYKNNNDNYSFDNYPTDYVPNDFNLESENKPVEKKTTNNAKLLGVKKAYGFVIKYSIKYKGFCTRYFMETDYYNPGKDLSLEFDILYYINTLQNNFYQGHIKGSLEEYTLKELLKMDDYKNYIDELMSSNFYDKWNEASFDGCIDKINKYLLQIKLNKLLKDPEASQEEIFKLQKELKTK